MCNCELCKINNELIALFDSSFYYRETGNNCTFYSEHLNPTLNEEIEHAYQRGRIAGLLFRAKEIENICP